MERNLWPGEPVGGHGAAEHESECDAILESESDAVMMFGSSESDAVLMFQSSSGAEAGDGQRRLIEKVLTWLQAEEEAFQDAVRRQVIQDTGQSPKKKHQTSSSTARMQFATDLADRHLEMHQCKRRGCCCKSFCNIYNLQVVFTPKSSNRVPFQV